MNESENKKFSSDNAQGAQDQLAAKLEALLFVSTEPLTAAKAAEILELTPKVVERGFRALQEQCERSGRGIQLAEIAGGWRFFTNPAFHDEVEAYVISWDTKRLTQAALEVLAIVAYGQPVTRQGIANVRGVNSDSSLNGLIEKGLVREVGAADTPGNPTLYGTTTGFLEKFGLGSTKDLPELSYFAPDEATKKLISERLSATHVDYSLIAPEDEDDDFDGLAFDFGEGITAVQSSESAKSDEEFSMAAAQEMLKEALASSLGVTDKIDFSELTFESEDD